MQREAVLALAIPALLLLGGAWALEGRGQGQNVPRWLRPLVRYQNKFRIVAMCLITGLMVLRGLLGR